MNRSIITATNTMSQLQKQIDNISNNIANVNTTGYKSREANFSELLYQNFNNQQRTDKEIGRLTPHGIRYGTGAKLGHTNVNYGMGNITKTDRLLDVALSNPSQFFRIGVQTDAATVEYRATRDGSFHLSPSADNSNMLELVTSSGHSVVDPNGQKILVPADYKQVTFRPDGSIFVTDKNGITTQNQLSIFHFDKPQLLESKGDNTYDLPFNLQELGYNENDIARVINPNEGSLVQGSLEQSNVDLSSEMTNLVMTQRSYQFNARAITLSDEMMGMINNIR
jgi:flagellar basal-body rod protein FlgG